MSEQIKDGTGKGYLARVDSKNRLVVSSTGQTILEHAADEGRSFNVNTGTVNLTSATESGILYLTNTGSNPLAIGAIGFLLGNSTGGTGDFECKVYKNPTTGTLISAATAADIIENKNFGSSKTLDGLAYKGVEGSTITNGDVAYCSLLPGAGRTYVISTGSIVIPKGSSIAVSVIPQASNTSMDLQIFMSVTESENL